MNKKSEIEERPPTFEEQLVALLPKLNKHALALTRSEQTADDLVQSTCVRALDRMDQWQGTGRFDGWVASIMDSIWFNELRQKRQRQEQELPEPEKILVRGFEGQVEAKFMLDMMRASTTVSDEDLSLVVKIHVYDYTYRDLAEEYDVPLGTMLSRVCRIKAILKNAAKERDQGEAS